MLSDQTSSFESYDDLRRELDAYKQHLEASECFMQIYKRETGYKNYIAMQESLIAEQDALISEMSTFNENMDVLNTDDNASHSKNDALHAKKEALHARASALHAKKDAIRAKYVYFQKKTSWTKNTGGIYYDIRTNTFIRGIRRF